jgi:diacylglycerol kinase family enzyme
MKPYSPVIIIYNPMSTSGKAKAKASRLQKQLIRRKYKDVRLLESEYPGHSEVIAYETTKEYKRPLIISVSGDGGYNEVINGALRAELETPGHQAICAIVAAGNANDHRRATAIRPMIWAITHVKPEPIDVLRIQYGKVTRYAHSYIGIGITGETVAQLNREKLTRWKEIKIVTRNLLNFQHFTIQTPERTREIDSLVFANIHRMSKIIRVNTRTDLHDGLFNFVLIPHRTRLKFLFILIGIVVFGVKNPVLLSSYQFTLPKPQLAQLDGEAIALPAKTIIKVDVLNEALLTVR